MENKYTSYIGLQFQILNVGLDGFVLKQQQVCYVYKWLTFVSCVLRQQQVCYVYKWLTFVSFVLKHQQVCYLYKWMTFVSFVLKHQQICYVYVVYMLQFCTSYNMYKKTVHVIT